MDQLTLNRLNQKQAMIDLRYAMFGNYLCDLCREQPGTQMHEIISRRYTVKQPEIRLLSFQVEICSLLCPFCHGTKAETRQGRMKLVEFNISLYGKDRFLKALYSIPEKYWERLIDLSAWKDADG
ncbi:MAG: hypothetical protein ABI835_16890 [Chloroflexota bacterium]